MKETLVKTVMIYLFNKNNQVLFLYRNKKINDINKNKYIGIGGHVEENESYDQAIIRETYEETSLTLTKFINRGKLLFINNNYKEIIYLYTSDSFIGDIKECDEGELIWVDINNINSLNMWEGDYYFINDLIYNSNYIDLKLYYKDDYLYKVIDNNLNKILLDR